MSERTQKANIHQLNLRWFRRFLFQKPRGENDKKELLKSPRLWQTNKKQRETKSPEHSKLKVVWLHSYKLRRIPKRMKEHFYILLCCHEGPTSPNPRSNVEFHGSRLRRRQTEPSAAGGHAETLRGSQTKPTRSLKAPPRRWLVQRSVVQLLVLGRRRGEDGGHGEDGGGPGRVPHLVDHDGGQGPAQDLQDRGGVTRRLVGPAQTGSASAFTSCRLGTIR